MANRTDPDAKSVHGTNPQVIPLSFRRPCAAWLYLTALSFSFFFSYACSLASICTVCMHLDCFPQNDRLLLHLSRDFSWRFAEPCGEDPAHKDLQYHVLEGALLCTDGRVPSRQSSGAALCGGNIWWAGKRCAMSTPTKLNACR